MKPASWKRYWISVLLTAILSGHSFTQTTDSQSKNQAIYESSTVLKAVSRLVVVDVVITDKKGLPVTGLTEKDFTVTDNGAPQVVRFFSFKETGSGGPISTPDHKANENVFTNLPDYKPGSSLNVILLDALNSDLTNQISTREQLVNFIATVPADRPTAIYALGKKLLLLQDFTTDPAILQAVIRNYKGGASHLLDNPGGNPESDSLGLHFLSGSRETEVMRQKVKQFLKETTFSEIELRANGTAEAFIALARALAAYPGRKNLIWLSEAFPLVVQPESTLVSKARAVQTTLAADSSVRSFDSQMTKAADALMNAQIALYPIDIRGIANSKIYQPNAGFNDAGDNIASPQGTQQELTDFSDELVAAHGTMTDLAEKTGGKAFFNTNDFSKAVRASMDDGSTYYTLGYYPSDKNWNGSFRRIRLHINRDDVKLRYRLGYFAIDPSIYQERSSDQRAQDLGLALGLDYPISTALIFKAEVLPPSVKTQNKVVVKYLVDAHAISFQKQEDGLQHALLSGAVQIYSEKGKPIKTEAANVSAGLPPDAFLQVMKSNLPFQITFDLPPGKYLLRLGIRDDRTGLLGSANATVVVN